MREKKIQKKLIAILLCVVFPSVALAEPTHSVLPNYSYKIIGGETWACYTFEGARLLKEMDLRCENCFFAQEELEKSLTDCQKITIVLEDVILRLGNVNELQGDLVLKLTQSRNLYMEKYFIAKRRSVFGGGFPWLVAALSVGLAIGAASIALVLVPKLQKP